MKHPLIEESYIFENMAGAVHFKDKKQVIKHVLSALKDDGVSITRSGKEGLRFKFENERIHKNQLDLIEFFTR